MNVYCKMQRTAAVARLYAQRVVQDMAPLGDSRRRSVVARPMSAPKDETPAKRT